MAAQAKAANAEAEAQHRALLIEQMKYTIAKLRHERFGQSSERRRRARAARAAACRVGGGCIAGRSGGAARQRRRRRAQKVADAGLRTAQAGAPAVAGASAARAHRLSVAVGVPVLRRCPAQARRGRDRDAGAGPAPVEGDPARAREVLLPVLRGDHPAAGAVASDRARPRRARAAGAYPVRQVRPASAAQPPERGLCPRGHRSRCLDAGRLGRRCGRDLDAAGRC